MKKCIVLTFCIVVSTSHFVSGQSDTEKETYEQYKQMALTELLLELITKGYDIVKGGTYLIRNLKQGEFDLHHTFFSSLKDVNPKIAKLSYISDIKLYQSQIVKEYQEALSIFTKDQNFSDDEIRYIKRVYSNLLDDCAVSIAELTLVVTSKKLEMTDDERLARVIKIFNDMQDKYSFLKNFNNKTKTLAIHKAMNANDVATLQKLYELKQ